jgi:hypothetical protein
MRRGEVARTYPGCVAEGADQERFAHDAEQGDGEEDQNAVALADCRALVVYQTSCAYKQVSDRMREQ